VIAITQGVQDFDPLPGAEDERIRVLQWLASCGVAATAVKTPTKAEILRRLPSAYFFHIACHGEFRPDSPAESGLILVSPKGEIDLLSLRELSRLDLTRMEQAILSSCWSADNFVLPGRWVISLPETLWRAGARSVLGSLWELNDKLAVSLSDRFYHALAAGLPRDEALRQAQLACLHQGGFRGPTDWAGLMLYGDTVRVKFGIRRQRRQAIGN
jgi:CHAT domain-containing protein